MLSPTSREWQFHASSPLEHHFRETVILAKACAADQAHLRSHAGIGASDVLHGAPTGPEFKVEPHLFHTLVLERLRFPLPVTEAFCECGSPLDVWGRHRAACPRSGRLRARAVGPERSLGREAGATVRCHAKLRDMNVAVSAQDELAIEVLASGLPIHRGTQLPVDVTMRCPCRPGPRHPRSSTHQRRCRASRALCSSCRGCRDVWILSVHWQEPGFGCTSVASPFFVLGLATPLVEDARCVLWQGVCQLFGDLLLRHA